MWPETVGVRTRSVWDKKKSELVLILRIWSWLHHWHAAGWSCSSCRHRFRRTWLTTCVGNDASTERAGRCHPSAEETRSSSPVDCFRDSINFWERFGSWHSDKTSSTSSVSQSKLTSAATTLYTDICKLIRQVTPPAVDLASKLKIF